MRRITLFIVVINCPISNDSSGQHEVAELSGGGVAEFPFSFSMPALLPSSYKGTHGSVDYTVTVTLKRAWGVHKEVVQPFQVCSQLDVASVHHLQVFIQTNWGMSLRIN